MAKYYEHSFPMAAGNDAATPPRITGHQYTKLVKVYGLLKVAIGIENWKSTDAAKASLLERAQFMTWQKTPGYPEKIIEYRKISDSNFKNLYDKVSENYDEFLRATGKNRIRERV
ncbi:unnamed protein product [Peronospora belbahrii]|uniref:Uncharacterized protein n=1 Tax=Peronospora belbahrii TaxID=622444 RepID=A0ABN8CSK8_9STRA|nr:unnamed protein product [Peronospora belbahrii]